MTDSKAEEHRRRAIRGKLASLDPASRASAIPTGFCALDQALDGGFPRRAISELFGPSSSGKTTLALQWVAHLQSQGLTAAWVDADHTFDPGYAAALGVALDGIPLARPDSTEQALEMVRRLVLSGAVDAVILDSAAALAPAVEQGVGLAGGAGLHSRVLASGLRSLAMALRKTDTAVLFLNQTRSRLQASAGELETSAGGPPLKLHAALRLVLEPLDGARIRFRTLKNKASGAFRDGLLRRADPLGFVRTP
jgi:recombination protein RecA